MIGHPDLGYRKRRIVFREAGYWQLNRVSVWKPRRSRCVPSPRYISFQIDSMSKILWGPGILDNGVSSFDRLTVILVCLTIVGDCNGNYAIPRHPQEYRICNWRETASEPDESRGSSCPEMNLRCLKKRDGRSAWTAA